MKYRNHKPRKGRFGPGRNAILGAQKARGRLASNLWKFYSLRNSCDVVLKSDVELEHFCWLEGDTTVSSYELEPPSFFTIVDGQQACTRFDARVHLRNGRVQLREVKDSVENLDEREQIQRAAQLQAAERAGAEYVVITREVLNPHRQLITNWRRAIPFLCACRYLVLEPYCEEIRVRLSDEPKTLYLLLGGLESATRTIYIAALLKLTQDGRGQSDLDSKPLCNNSQFWRGRPGGAE